MNCLVLITSLDYYLLILVFSYAFRKYLSIGKMLVKLSDELNIDEHDPMLRQVLNMINVNNGSKTAFRDFSEVAER